MSILKLSLGALACILLLVAKAGAEQPFILSSSYWLDRVGTASLQEAMHAPYVDADDSLTLGYTSAALWLKLRIAGSETPISFALVVKPPFLRKIELHDPSLSPAGTKPTVSGRDAALAPGSHIGLDNGFIIATATAPRDIFLRITTTTSLSTNVTAMTLLEAERQSIAGGAILAVYFAFLLSISLWALANLAIRRELIYGLFVLRLAFSMAHLFVWFGLLKYFFSEVDAQTRDFIYNIITVTIIAVAGAFDYRLLSEFRPAKWLQKLFLGVMSLAVIGVTLLLLGHTQSALRVNAFVVSVAMIVLLLLALSVRERDQVPYERNAVIVIRCGFLIMTLLIFVPALMHQRLIGANITVMSLLHLHAVVSAIILSVVLTIRARQRDWVAQQSLLQVRMKERELEAESLRRMEKERFLSMLTHELRNPLSLIRLVAASEPHIGKTVEKAAVQMSRIIERVEQSEKLDGKEINVEATSVTLRQFLEDVVSGSSEGRVDLNICGDVVFTTDETLLRSIMTNLLDNAHKYGAPGSRIGLDATIVTEADREGVMISVTNHVGNAGIPDPEKVFTKYYRNRRAHRQPGSGLGLFLVASWTKAIGGRIGCDTRILPDGGRIVSFSLWVPR